jgi:predicted O-linked N-acetylglucosamine transferase (SPINDLY family)
MRRIGTTAHPAAAMPTPPVRLQALRIPRAAPRTPTKAGRVGTQRPSATAHHLWQRGVDYARERQHAQARVCFEQAVALEPEDALYWLNLAVSEHRLGRTLASVEAARRAQQIDRASLLYCTFLAERLREQHRHSEALHTLDQLDAATERDAQWHGLRGAALAGLERHHEAVAEFTHSLTHAGQDAAQMRHAALHLGHSLAALKMHQAAAQCYRMVLDLDPLALGSALYAAHYAAWACDWTALDEDLARLHTCLDAVRASPAGVPADELAPFCLLTLSDDPALHRWLASHAGNHRSRVATTAASVPARPCPRPDGRLRIGWLSSDFHHHATAILLAEVLEHLPKDRFDLVFYSAGPDDQSPLRRRVLATAARVHEVAQWADEQLAQQIRDDQIAVLIDLKGHTRGARLQVLAARPAPLQLAWLGYPGSSGSPHIDYLIGDPIVTPLDTQDGYTEQIAQLPHCYQPNDSSRSRPAAWSRARCGLPETGVVFASFNQAYKLGPEVFGAWCQILAACDGSVLWLLVPEATTQQRLRDAAQARGVDPAQLIFAPFLGVESHRARLPNVDLFLDTFPCNGHTTASDALWAGAPVLTLQGRTFAARVAASLLHTLGLDELVCTELAAYVECAIRLGRDDGARTALRARLEQARTDSPLFDGRRFATDLTHLLLRMVQRHDAGLPPTPLAAESTAAAPDGATP